MKAPLSRDAFGNIVYFVFFLIVGPPLVTAYGRDWTIFWIFALPVIALVILRIVFFVVGYSAKGYFRKK